MKLCADIAKKRPFGKLVNKEVARYCAQWEDGDISKRECEAARVPDRLDAAALGIRATDTA